MSSILKALKKIEGRKVDTPLPAWHSRYNSREATDSHIRRSRQRQKILGGLILLCLAALAGKFYIGWRDPERGTSTNTRVTEFAVTENPAKRGDTADRRSPAASPDVSPGTAPPSPETSAATASMPVMAPTSEASAEATPRHETAAATPEDDSVGTASPPEETAVTPAGPAERSTPETFDPAPANNAGLTLQALVWSTQPDQRFVVINGRILREGGAIDEATVVKIEENFVVIRTGDGTWKLR